MTDAYPLAWPEGQPRTKNPQPSRFQTTLHRAIENVREELRRFGNDTGKPVRGLILSSNFNLTDQRPRDAGVAAYFQWDDMACCIAVDRYRKVEENLQAISKVIEADRAKMRHGGLNIVRAAFRGYAALPPPTNRKPWWDVLGVPEDCRLDIAREAHRTLAVRHHPDAGGDAATMAEINRAWDEARMVLA
ncbi:MAG: J domain-containing protein [Chloroflexi bacterium]|nr:J domain-containing protein [Chloroflexota bacterium]